MKFLDLVASVAQHILSCMMRNTPVAFVLMKENCAKQDMGVVYTRGSRSEVGDFYMLLRWWKSPPTRLVTRLKARMSFLQTTVKLMHSVVASLNTKTHLNNVTNT